MQKKYHEARLDRDKELYERQIKTVDATQWHTAYCIAPQNFSSNFSATAICGVQFILHAGTLFANANGERLRAGGDYQVFVIWGVEKGVMDVRCPREF